MNDNDIRRGVQKLSMMIFVHSMYRINLLGLKSRQYQSEGSLLRNFYWMWIAATYFFHWSIKNSSSEYYFIVKWRKYFLNWGLPFSTEDPFVIYYFSPLFPTLPYSPLLFCDRFCLHGMVFQLCLIIIWTLSEILMLKTSFLVFIKYFF